MGRRSYGTGTLYARRDGNGCETWYGSWRVAGTRVKRRIGPKRRPGAADGLTRTQAEAQLRRRIATDVVVAGAQRRRVAEGGRGLPRPTCSTSWSASARRFRTTAATCGA